MRESIARHTGIEAGRDEIEKAETGDGGKPPAATPRQRDDSGRFSSQSGGEETDQEETKTDDQEESPSPFSLAAIRKWAEENPEEAAKVGAEVFKADDQEWIKLQNRSRKKKQALIEERKLIMGERERLQQEQREFTENAEKFVPILDMLEAGQGDSPDFDAVDTAFQQITGRTLDDYVRARARRGIHTDPQAAALRAENARLKKQLETGKPAEEAKSEPKVEMDAVLPDIDEEHPIRKLHGWESLLRKAAAPHYDPDTDEFEVDVDALAHQVFTKELEKLRPAPQQQDPKPKETQQRRAPRRPAAKRAARPADDDDPSGSTDRQPDEVYLKSERPADMDPLHWATTRAQLRAQGKLR